jgi:hypothetical protein
MWLPIVGVSLPLKLVVVRTTSWREGVLLCKRAEVRERRTAACLLVYSGVYARIDALDLPFKRIYSFMDNSTACTSFDGGTQRRGFRSRIVITHKRTTHEMLKVPPNDADGLVVSYKPLV